MSTRESALAAISLALETATTMNDSHPFAEYHQLFQLLQSARDQLSPPDVDALKAIHDRLGQLLVHCLSDLDGSLESRVLKVQVQLSESILEHGQSDAWSSRGVL